jgi:hypothetical protein
VFLSTIVCSFCPFCFDHCIVCTLTCGFWLHLWYLLTIVLSVLWLTASDYTFGIFWPLYCLYFDLRLLITPLVSFDHCIVCTLTYSFWLHLCIVCTLMASVYTFGIFWPLYCLYFDGFCLHFWYLLTIVLSVLWLTASDYTFGIVWPLYCLYFDGFCLHLWHLLTIVLSVLWLTASDYTFGIFWPLYCLYFDGFCLHLWYLSNFSYNGSMTQPFRKHFKFTTEQPNTSRFIWYYHQILSK